MGSVMRGSLQLLAALAILGGTARSEVTYEVIGFGLATAISADGSVVVGNTEGDYETFRWTEEEGIVPLGRASLPVLGRAAGTPDVSDDGTRVSATILGADSTYITQGRWTLGLGWEETMPPVPPDGGLLDEAYGSGWGLSGDGETLTGLYWRPGHGGPEGDGLAHASAWTQAGGLVDLGSSGRDSRANDANYDGSVIVGWDSNPDFGNWWPTVWVDGELTHLSTPDAFTEASCVNHDGTVIGGQSYDESTSVSVAAAWRWNGAAWEEELLGALPGTGATFGLVIVEDMTADGSLMVGYNRFSNPGHATGFIWTEATGLIDVEDFLAANDIIIPNSFNILSLSGVSDDGTVMVGVGQDTAPPFLYRFFIIRTDGLIPVPVASAVSAPPRVHAVPNPTSGPLTLQLDIPESGQVGLEVYDLNGRLVRRLLDGPRSAGRHEVAWDGRDAGGSPVPSGVYYYRLRAGTHQKSDKLIVTR